MKIKTLQLIDLLCHVDSRVEVAEYLTVFTGVSDSGKSVALRGLDQTCRNRPAGIDLLRHGAKRGANSVFEMTVEDDAGKMRKIARKRGKTLNSYELDGQTLLAIGREVPEEVSSILRLSANAFQLQQDGNFLLSETDGEVARVLSGTVGLAQIDAAFSAVRKRKTENDTDLRLAQADVDRETEAAAKFAGIEDAETWVATAERLGAELLRCDVDIERVSSAAYELEALPMTQDCGHPLSLWHVAVLAQAAAEKASFEAEAGRRLLEQLEVLPPNVGRKGEEARCLVMEAVNYDVSVEDERAVLDCVVTLHNRIVTCPQSVGIAPRRAALLLTRATNAIDAWSVARIAVGDVECLLEQLYSLKPDEVKMLEVADMFCLEASNSWERARDGIIEMDEVTDFERELTRVIQQGAVYQGEQVLEEQAIERYRSTHPVCPECGAEQQHWHVG